MAPLSTAFQLWYDCPTTLFHANNKLLGENWNCKDRPAVTVNISTAAPKLTMLFNGMLAGIPAVILAGSGASLVIIDQPFALHHQLNIRPCPYASANLASGVSVDLIGQTTFKLRLGTASFTVTALVMSSIVPSVHLILGDEWLVRQKCHLDYDESSLWFCHHGNKVLLSSLSRAA